MTYRDSLCTTLRFDIKPERVLSLVPSITEWLIDLGVNVVGRTKFCIHPKEKVADIPMIGGTKNFRFETIEKIAPDLIIGNKEENYLEGVVRLRKKYPVWITEINNFQDSLLCFDELSKCLSVEGKWGPKRHQICAKYQQQSDQNKGSLIYLIWQKPFMAVGKGTYINSVLCDFGYHNLVTSERYPEIEIDEIIRLSPDYLFLSSEPYPFKKKHVMEIQSQLPNTKVRLVDGEYYSWYGTRFLNLKDDYFLHT